MPVRDLSGGQKARVVFASLALKRPHLTRAWTSRRTTWILRVATRLVEGLGAYEGGVLAVTHDAALVEALSRDENGVELPLFVCRDSKVCVERGGFAKYRRDVAKAAELRVKRRRGSSPTPGRRSARAIAAPSLPRPRQTNRRRLREHAIDAAHETGLRAYYNVNFSVNALFPLLAVPRIGTVGPSRLNFT